MRQAVMLLAAAVAALPALARADAPASCAPGVLQKVTLASDALTLRAGFRAPDGFDPAATGLDVAVSFEPETDSANAVFLASVPPLGRSGRALTYEEPGGALSVRLTGRGRAKKIVLRVALDAPLRTGTLRLVLATETSCVRTCGAACVAGARFKCRKPKDRKSCGTRAG